MYVLQVLLTHKQINQPTKQLLILTLESGVKGTIPCFFVFVSGSKKCEANR